ncbi:hypothetical protein B6U96_17335 [Archaeoglobales archaeon ex4484_92]|nr:MAG: hypothetical protein B6U96_17335 [Archaeoglobales archaeon ex4484_92]
MPKAFSASFENFIGSFIKLDSRRTVLSNTGIPLLSQGVPKPMLLELVYTDDESYTIEVAAKEVHDLSYIHWAYAEDKIASNHKICR